MYELTDCAAMVLVVTGEVTETREQIRSKQPRNVVDRVRLRNRTVHDQRLKLKGLRKL